MSSRSNELEDLTLRLRVKSAKVEPTYNLSLVTKVQLDGWPSECGVALELSGDFQVLLGGEYEVTIRKATPGPKDPKKELAK